MRLLPMVAIMEGQDLSAGVLHGIVILMIPLATITLALVSDLLAQRQTMAGDRENIALEAELRATADDSFGADGDSPVKRLLTMDVTLVPDDLLLAVLVAGATGGKDPVEVSREMLRRAMGDLASVSRQDVLHEQVTPTGKARLLAARELYRRAMYREAAGQVVKMTGAADVLPLAKAMAGLDVEWLGAIFLGTRLQVLGSRVLSRGGQSFTILDPSQVMRAALGSAAYGVVIVHNHPSGDPLPSAEDREATKRVADAGRIVGVKLLDHIVIGRGEQYRSFAEMGIMP